MKKVLKANICSPFEDFDIALSSNTSQYIIRNLITLDVTEKNEQSTPLIQLTA